MRHPGPPLSTMPRTDYGLPLLVLVTLLAWALAAASLAADLVAVAVALVLVPVAVGAYREQRLAFALALLSAAAYAGLAAANGLALLPAALGTVALAAIGLLVAGALGAAADEAGAYRVWYHGLRDRLPAATLFFMPATGRVHDLNERAAALLGPFRSRSLEDAFEDPGAYAAFTADVAAGEIVRRGAWLRGGDGTRRWCELRGAMATPVLAVVSVDDRTAEREAADAIAASEAAYRALAAHLPGAAALLVDDGLRCTAAGGTDLGALAGDGAAVTGRTLWTAFPERIVRGLEPLARLAAFGTPGEGELEVDGRHLLLGARPVARPDGTVGGAVLLATDATDLADRLVRSEEGRVLANVLLEVRRAGEGRAADRLLSAAVRMTGSRYGAVLGVEGGELVPISVSPALRDAPGRFEPRSLMEDLERPHCLNDLDPVRLPEGHLPVRRLLTVPAIEDGRLTGLIAVADRAGPYTEREAATLRALADEGVDAALRDGAAARVAAGYAGLEAVVESAPLPLLLVDRGGRVLEENAAARRLFGTGAPGDLSLRLVEVDRNRVRTTEERRRHGARGVPTRYLAGAIGDDGAARPCLVAAAFLKSADATLLVFVELAVVAAHDRCRDRALAALEARLEAALRTDPADLADALAGAWRASARERAVLGAPTPFESLPPDCADYS